MLVKYQIGLAALAAFLSTAGLSALIVVLVASPGKDETTASSSSSVDYCW